MRRLGAVLWIIAVTTGPAAAQPVATTSLEGTSWRLVSLPDQTPSAVAALERVPTVRLDAGSLSGFGGCNRLIGSYTLQQNRLTFAGVAGTMMACPEPAMSVERALHAALTGTVSYAITGDRLSLTAASGAVLVFDKEPAATLEGTTWEVTGYNNGRQAVVSPITGTQLSVAFEKGSVSGQAGCNSFRAPFSVEGDRITIGPAAATRKMCGEAVMTQEREFLKALESAATWSIDAGLLDLHRADGERVLVGPRRR
jgi:heat shock protein HslJ